MLDKVFEILKIDYSEENVHNLLELVYSEYDVKDYSIEMFISDNVLRITVYKREGKQ